jgi:hypothetical protein
MPGAPARQTIYHHIRVSKFDVNIRRPGVLPYRFSGTAAYVIPEFV